MYWRHLKCYSATVVEIAVAVVLETREVMEVEALAQSRVITVVVELSLEETEITGCLLP